MYATSIKKFKSRMGNIYIFYYSTAANDAVHLRR